MSVLARCLDYAASVPSLLRSRIVATLPPMRPGFRRALVAPFVNSGGRNDLCRFAGRLVRTDLSKAESSRIYHALILANGVRKTTHHARNTAKLQSLLTSGELALPRRVRVLDIGASRGADALATADLLRANGFELAEYVLGDLYPRILYDDQRGLVFDEDGILLQARRPHSFVSMHFCYTNALQRITHLPKRLLPWLLQRRYRWDPRAPLVSIPLVDPALRVDDPASPFRLQRLDVFRPFGGDFDLILCLNLLLPQYFSPADVERATANLTAHLAPGGAAVVGGDAGLHVVPGPRLATSRSA